MLKQSEIQQRHTQLICENLCLSVAKNGCSSRQGFSLIEVLAALGLCAFLATATAGAVAFSARAEQLATRDAEASLMLPALYAAQRLRPTEELPSAFHDWKIINDSEMIRLSDDLRQEWHCLYIQDATRTTRPFTVRILNDAP